MYPIQKAAGIWLAAATLLAASFAAVAGTAAAAGVDRLYVLNCGQATAPDQSRWSPGVNVNVPIEFSNNCYLIHHTAGGYLLWDTGVPDAVAGMPDGMQNRPGAPVWRRPKTLLAQLAELGLTPEDIKLVAVSHFHPDHAGNVDLFPSATVLIQRAEYDFAFAQPRIPFSAGHPVDKLEGDKDVFGDGSVMIFSTPGHTPGHQSLLVRLPKTGNLILSGDAVHFRSNWDNRRVPGFSFDNVKTAASMQRIADMMAKHHAQLWINHDKPQSDSLKRSPQYYE